MKEMSSLESVLKQKDNKIKTLENEVRASWHPGLICFWSPVLHAHLSPRKTQKKCKSIELKFCFTKAISDLNTNGKIVSVQGK